MSLLEWTVFVPAVLVVAVLILRGIMARPDVIEPTPEGGMRCRKCGEWMACYGKDASGCPTHFYCAWCKLDYRRVQTWDITYRDAA